MPGVLFVCTGNICRSPMAEYLARELTPDAHVIFSSAGTATYQGVGPSEGTRIVLEELDIAVGSHRSRSVWEVGADADVIYALSGEHRDAMVSRWPDRTSDIHLLRPDGGSIADPLGLDLEAYRRTRQEIEAAVRERIAMGWSP